MMQRPMIARATRLQQYQYRAFSVSSSKRADLVQDIYLREIKAYKAPTVSAKDAEGQVSVGLHTHGSTWLHVGKLGSNHLMV